ncbi:hypothetical protein B0T21DRAFT_411927 [Apiosordaria backusii]|uniref:Uncharacterized protein n=1 Tax=Apiosordaria backusii TaxID=314023 RepID=A0AA40BM53_9PEZI|nr:hypothetical protein B0T21DRAFT_411927 [Apiosordaria backusii]
MATTSSSTHNGGPGMILQLSSFPTEVLQLIVDHLTTEAVEPDTSLDSNPSSLEPGDSQTDPTTQADFWALMAVTTHPNARARKPQPSALLALARVCPRFSTLARRALYSTVELSSSRQISSLLRCLSFNTPTAIENRGFIKRLEFDTDLHHPGPCSNWRSGLPDKEGRKMKYHEIIASLFTLIGTVDTVIFRYDKTCAWDVVTFDQRPHRYPEDYCGKLARTLHKAYLATGIPVARHVEVIGPSTQQDDSKLDMFPSLSFYLFPGMTTLKVADIDQSSIREASDPEAGSDDDEASWFRNRASLTTQRLNHCIRDLTHLEFINAPFHMRPLPEALEHAPQLSSFTIKMGAVVIPVNSRPTTNLNSVLSAVAPSLQHLILLVDLKATSLGTEEYFFGGARKLTCLAELQALKSLKTTLGAFFGSPRTLMDDSDLLSEANLDVLMKESYTIREDARALEVPSSLLDLVLVESAIAIDQETPQEIYDKGLVTMRETSYYCLEQLAKAAKQGQQFHNWELNTVAVLPPRGKYLAAFGLGWGCVVRSGTLLPYSPVNS